MSKMAIKSKITRDSFTESVWQEIETLPLLKAEYSNETIYDALIVGAGITGITAALILQKAGKKCIIAEARNILFGTSSGTTAHLNTFFDATYPEIDSKFDTAASKQVAQVAKSTLQTIKNFIKEYQIDCDFEEKDGYLFSENEKESEQLAQILESSREANIVVAEADTNGTPVPFQHSLKFNHQAQFHPVKYLLRLIDEFQKLGGIVLENTLIHRTSYKDEIHTAIADHLTIKAKHVFYATHTAPGVNLLSFRCAPYRSYVLGIKLSDENYPDCVAYDMQEPYHYFRTHVINGEKILILGGEDHKTGHADPTIAFENLESYARRYYKVQSIPYRWSAQYYTSADTLPYIGQMPAGDDKLYVATGFNGNGMQFGTLSAMIISDIILGNTNEFIDLFKPSRVKPIAGFSEFIKENADVAYHFIADRFSAEAIETLSEIRPGEGRLVDFENQKIAVYKSNSGKISALNPVCTHAKCIVNFNEEEKSWDCPCHGGRFDLDGKVLTGPPRHNLQKIDLTK
jgi:glycine/D-amino acid oxidase-like deaminating enzyme/nitrite reductase/ring-hydroxylating ferredoxin subunit